MIFLLSIRFLDDRYHGLTESRSNREWPPSPFRVFQAIVAGNASSPSISEKIVASLEWLESLSPPEIIAPDALDGQRIQTYVLNNVSDSDPGSRAPKTILPTLLSHDRLVEYAWTFEPSISSAQHIETLIAAVRRINAVGWGIDLAIGHGQEINVLLEPPLHRHLYHPRNGFKGGLELRVPRKGSLASLKKAHDDFLARYESSGITRHQSSPVSYETIRYAVSEVRNFVAFRFLDADDEDVAYRTDHIKQIAGQLRRMTAKACAGRFDEAVINGTILGHPKESPRLSILPIPSIGHRHVDGRVRRVIFAEPLGSTIGLCEHLLRMLDQQPMDFDGDCPCPSSRLSVLPRGDAVLSRYVTASTTWATVTPILLPGHNQRKQDTHVKAIARACQLIAKSLLQADITIPATFEIERVPFWPGTRHVRDYDPRDKLAHCPRYHTKIIFNQPVSGPISIGAGRHVGFGTLAALSGEE